MKNHIDRLFSAEGINLEEISGHLCILLREEDNCTLGHFFLLLCGYPTKCFSSWSCSPKANSHLHSGNHYISKCNLHAQVINFLLKETFNFAPFPQSSNNAQHRSLHLVVFWILFENVMSLHRTKAAIIGLLEANRVNEWVVTEKLGNQIKQKNAKASKKPRSQIGERYFLFYFILVLYRFPNHKDDR